MKLTSLKTIFRGIILLAAFLIAGCEEKISGSFNQNIPPETTVFVQSNDTLNFTPSVQTIFWDGADPDGFVTGFFYTFEENPSADDWQWTTERSNTFPLQISGTDTIYRFQVKAVDNQNEEDPTPAVQLFPIINSPPEISWATASNIPDTTFTVASFTWTASDPDGESTIDIFEYAIDDTSVWLQIPGEKRSITLTETDGIVPGEHAFFIRAVDIAGALSSTIRMPETPGSFWFVKPPQGRYLLIDDYEVESNASAFPDSYYQTMLDSILAQTGDSYSYWNIEELFPASITQFTESLKLFDRIIWYTDLITTGDDHFIAAQIAIPQFLQTGGKLIYTVQFNTGFGGQGSPLVFSPVDSLAQSFNVIPTNSSYYPDPNYQTAIPGLPVLPNLSVSSFIVGLFSLVPKASSVPLYRYDVPNSEDDPIFIMAGRNDNTGEFDFVFSGTPMHFLRGNNNLNEFFDIMLIDLLGP